MPPAVGLDDNEGLFVDAVFLELAPHLGQHRVGLGLHAFQPGGAAGVELAALTPPSG
jgi:hypothetical protein